MTSQIIKCDTLKLNGTNLGLNGVLLPVIPPGDTFATNTGTATLQNKSIDDSNSQFVDHADITKQATFNLSGATTGTKLTLVSSQTANRSITLPDATDQLVGRATTDTLTNKTLTSPSTTNALLSTPTFSGTATGPLVVTTSISSTQLIASGSTNQLVLGNASNFGTSTLSVLPPGIGLSNNYTLPTLANGITTTLVGADVIQTLTNKTLTSPAINTASSLSLVTTGGTPASLTFYEEHSIGLLSATQPWAAAQTITFTMKKQNQWVTLSWQDMSATSTSAAKITFTLDLARYKPANNFNTISVSGQDNSNPVVITMIINATTGVITFSSGTTGANFTNVGTASVFSGSVTYLST